MANNTSNDFSKQFPYNHCIIFTLILQFGSANLGREPDTLLLPPRGNFEDLYFYSPVCPEYYSTKFATFQWGVAEKINFKCIGIQRFFILFFYHLNLHKPLKHVCNSRHSSY